MGANPFDARLSPTRGLSLEEAQTRAQKLTQICEARRAQNRASWEEHKREHHERRLEQALEHEALDETFYPTLVREKRDREDDIHYSYLMDFDQLLELPTHKEYLRARRAWERRCTVKEVELNVTVQPGLRGPQTGRQLWSLAVALLMGFGFLSCLGQVGVGGLLSLPIWIGLWVAFTWLPLVYVGTFSGDGGRGASSSAI